jgi:uncharacterized flavoprotein (TIGR03862 family)
MAAETARAAGCAVEVYDAKGSVGRKFLLAGKGGLNLTHNDPLDVFASRYRDRAKAVGGWLREFDADALRDWARGLGVETFVGTSGRVFPTDLKAAPLLRGWLRRLRVQGVQFRVQHRLTGIEAAADGSMMLHFVTPTGQRTDRADAMILALGGASWPQLGSDGAWVPWLSALGAEVAPLVPANCGFDVGWSEVFSSRFAGQPVKPVAVRWTDAAGVEQQRQGEFVVSAAGVEGSLIYAISADVRDALAARDQADAEATTAVWARARVSRASVAITLDLLPSRDEAAIATALARPRGSRSLTEHLRRTLSLDGVRTGLLYEFVPKEDFADAVKLAAWIKALPLRLLRPRPIAEAISSAGGVRLESLDDALMLRVRPGVFCAGEMLDWEAPTGGYLLTACFASGQRAGQGAARWLSAG